LPICLTVSALLPAKAYVAGNPIDAAVIGIIAGSTATPRVTIGDIIRDPGSYAGRAVAVAGKYGGWSYGGDVPVTDQGPPATRSDWCLYDGSGAIYVQAGGGAEVLEQSYPGRLDPMDPACLGSDLVVRGTVRVSGKGVPYLG